jgi:hypothetical protein
VRHNEGRPLAGAVVGLQRPPVLDTYKQLLQPNIHAGSSPIEGSKMNAVLAMPEAPWNEGYQAGLVGLGVNPYPAFSRAGWAWSAGYIDGRAAHAKSTS